MSATVISGGVSPVTTVDRDRDSVLHPFTPAHAHRAGSYPVTVMEGGSGVYVMDDTGRRYLDGFAGLYCVNVGYGRMEIADAIAAQARQLAYYHSYAGHTTEALAKLASRLTAMAPGNMQKVFFGLSGSDANETQAKIVWYYNNLRGKPLKKKIISRERGYHGCSVISGSMTGLKFYHDHMDLPFPLILHTGVPHHYWGSLPGESEEDFSKRRAMELDALIMREGPDTVGAFIAEPVLGTGGLIPPPKRYWELIQEVLKRHDVLMIADEVVCGFGRLGTPFGCDLYGITPDLMTVAKGMTSAYAPLSGVLIGPTVYEVIERASDTIGSFSHGYTYTGHPISIAAANANLDIIERENITQQAQQRGAYLQRRLADTFRDHPFVGEVRGVGMLAAVEFVEDPSSKRPFPAGTNFAASIAQEARNRGVIVRAMPHGEIIGFAPPLIISEAEIEEMVGKVAEAAQVVAAAHRRR